MALKAVFLFLISIASFAQAELLPMQPLFNKTSNEFVGVYIQLNSKALHELKGSINRPWLPEQIEAIRQVRSIGLNYAFTDGNVIGMLPKFHAVEFKGTEEWGVFSSGGCQLPDSLCIGNNISYGFKFSFSAVKPNDLIKDQGLYISDPLSSIIKSGNFLIKRRSSVQVVQDLIHLTSATVAANDTRKNSLDWPEDDFEQIKQIKLSELQVKSEELTRETALPEHWSQATQQMANSSNLKKELSWKKYIAAANQHAPIWKNEQAQTYLQNLCDRILQDKNLPAKCRVFASLLPYAFSYPGGDIFVTTGLLASIENEATLAFFLSHEMAHVYERHFSTNLDKKEYMAKLMSTLSLASAVFAVKSPVLQILEKMSFTSKGIDAQHLFNGAMTLNTDEDEVAADQMAVEMITSLGYQHADLMAGLNSLNLLMQNSFSGTKKANKSPSLDARYSSLNDRIKKIAALKTASQPGEQKKEASSELASFQKTLRPIFESFRFAVKSEQFTD